MFVPLLDLKEQLKPLRDDIVAEVTKLIDSTGYIMGEKVTELERDVSSYCQTRHGIGVSSGTDALLAALMGLGIGPGDFVLTTPYTFIATLGCILRLGARPIFVDIDPVSFNIDPDRIEEVFENEPTIAKKIKAILPVHLYGQCADMPRILALAERYNVSVVEDAAQAIGAACPFQADGDLVWKRAGNIGDAGCFSFFPSKNLGGIGDGGMIVLNDDQLAEKIRVIRVHGGAPKYHHAVVGGNFRLDPIQAAALLVKLPHLGDWHKARRRNAAIYSRLFEDAGLVASGKVKLPVALYADIAAKDAGAPDYHIYNQYIIRAENRDDLKEHLQQNGVGCEIYYPIPLHKQECMTATYNNLSMPEADKAASETLALPIYPELNKEMLQYVVEQIAAFY
jgi:dTDP-4-amino-4,6-dideoxygalactose transaminase